MTEVAEQTGSHYGRVWAFFAMGRVYLLDEAAACAAESAGVMLPLVALERAELARVLGDDAARRDALREAHRLSVKGGATIQAERIARLLSAS